MPTAPKLEPLISIQSVIKTYGDDIFDVDQQILKNVNVEVFPGEFVIIFGPSGSGKSTLLNLMAGLERASSGLVLVRQRDLTQYSSEDLALYHRTKMGMVFQAFNLIKSLKVWENVALPQTASGVSYLTRKQKAQHLLELFGLEDYMNRHPSELSGGEQQRVAIARALINNPSFLLVDEPTGNLDSRSADDVMRIFHDLHYRSKHTIVLVTHNPDYLHFGSRVIYVQDGEIIRQEHNDHDPMSVNAAFPEGHAAQLAQYRDQPESEQSTDGTNSSGSAAGTTPHVEIGPDGSVVLFGAQTQPQILAQPVSQPLASAPAQSVSSPPVLFADTVGPKAPPKA